MSSTPIGADSQASENEELFRDFFTHLFSSAANISTVEEVHFANTLLRLFPTCTISVVYSTGASNERRSTGAQASLKGPPRELQPQDIDRILNVQRDNFSRRDFRLHGTIWTRLRASDCTIIIECWGKKHEALSDILVLVLDGLGDPSRDRAAWLTRYITGLSQLYLAIKALKSASNLAGIRQRIDNIKLRQNSSVSHNLHEINVLVNEIIHYCSTLPQREYLHELENIASWATQVIFDTEYLHRSDALLNEDEILNLFNNLHEAAKKLCSRGNAQRSVTIGGESFNTLLRLKSLCVVATSDRAYLQDGVERVQEEPELDLLIRWAPLHRLYKEPGNDSGQEDDDREGQWDRVAKYTLPVLNTLLQRRFQSTLSLQWLHLWLCYQLLSKCQDEEWKDHALLPAEKWRFRAALAFVMREVLRFWCFSNGSENVFQTHVYASALLTVVEQHAHWIGRLSRDFDLRTLLNQIGKERDPDDLAFATSHLQHALQNYIVGHFLCSLRVRSEVADRRMDINNWTVAEVLASQSGSRPGDGRQKEFLQAFSLAALFHDVGLLMFPRMFFEPEKLIQNDDQLQERLKKLRGQIGESAKELVEHCEKELRDAKYFDPMKESSLSSALSRLKEKCLEKCTGDHSVLGAWYLHRSVQNLNDMDLESVVKPAVRAVLLHQIYEIREQSVNTAEDPVAGLLILCDQVFECLPGSRTRVNGNHWVNRSPDGFRSSAIRLPELAMRMGDKDEMICELVLNDNSFTDGWPSIEIELVHPDYHSAPPYHAWLAFVQNLSRLQKSELGWSGNVILKSQIPSAMYNTKTHVRKFLQDVVDRTDHPFKVPLRRFLIEGRFNHAAHESGFESVRVGPLDRPFFVEDFDKMLDVLDTEYRRVCDGSRRTP
jgi:hypothetical protein